MSTKAETLAALRAEFDRWQAILSNLTDAQIHTPQSPSHWTVKDVVAHLWAWQSRTLARVQAAVDGTAPQYEPWPPQFDPEVPEEPDDLNAWLYDAYRDRPWAAVYADWQSRYQRIIALAEAIPEPDLTDPARFDWLGTHALGFILRASAHHHAEHRGWLIV
jgi:hypothetical protein